jgi:hypothetical protein
MNQPEWLTLAQRFFKEKNLAWLTDADDVMLEYLAGTPSDCASYQEVRALRQALPHRQARFRKARTNLRILATHWDAKRELAVVEALESVRFYYEQGDRIDHEERQSMHRLTMVPFGGKWQIVEDAVERERTSPLVRQEEFGTEEPLSRALRGRYDRVRAFKYAELWWNGYNPQFQKMQGNDCSNYVSQVLHAGGMPMVGGNNRSQGWWYRWQGKRANWSYSWAVAHSLRLALPKVLHAVQVGDPRLLKVGDIICYDWDGDDRWQHNTVVVDFDWYGRPLVNAHTIASHRRYWDYRDSYAFTPRTRYLFFHIPDQF